MNSNKIKTSKLITCKLLYIIKEIMLNLVSLFYGRAIGAPWTVLSWARYRNEKSRLEMETSGKCQQVTIWNRTKGPQTLTSHAPEHNW